LAAAKNTLYVFALLGTMVILISVTI